MQDTLIRSRAVVKSHLMKKVRDGFLRIFLACLCVALLLPAMPVEGAPRLWDSRERKSSKLKTFPKWLDVLEKYRNEKATTPADCTSTRFNACHLQRWQDFLETLQGMGTMQKIREVNRYMNEAPYIRDPINWGVADYWESPREFFLKNGDCEDYAIMKFLSLRRLGFSNSQMRVVVLKDQHLRVHHSVLAVYVGGQIYILDNQIKQVVKQERIKHYKPIYSINETNWWRHR